MSPTRNAIKRPFLAKLPNGQVDNYSEPRALATQEIPVIVQQFRRAARNAIIAGKKSPTTLVQLQLWTLQAAGGAGAGTFLHEEH